MKKFQIIFVVELTGEMDIEAIDDLDAEEKARNILEQGRYDEFIGGEDFIIEDVCEIQENE